MIREQGNLIRLLDLDDDFIIDLKYATADNFTGMKIYASGECWIDRHTAQILCQAKDMFKKDGYRVKIMDAYRPISAQARFWELLPDDRFVARPPDIAVIKKFRPTHMNGMCVDVTLTDMDGNELEMPAPFDTLTVEASLNYPGHTETARKNGTYLRNVMESVGFLHYDDEWWHFYDMTGEPQPFTDYPI